jgi:hypothetical protein
MSAERQGDAALRVIHVILHPLEFHPIARPQLRARSQVLAARHPELERPGEIIVLGATLGEFDPVGEQHAAALREDLERIVSIDDAPFFERRCVVGALRRGNATRERREQIWRPERSVRGSVGSDPNFDDPCPDSAIARYEILMTLVVDIRHWLDENGDPHPKVRRQALRVARLIEYRGPLRERQMRETLIECTRRPARKACPGLLWVAKTDDGTIEAFCQLCDAERIYISGWQGHALGGRADGGGEPG